MAQILYKHLKKLIIIKNSKNNQITSSIVKKAHNYKVSVEGEIGFVGYANGKNSKGTLIDEAIKFSRESNVDAMAISLSAVGSLRDDLSR